MAGFFENLGAGQFRSYRPIFNSTAGIIAMAAGDIDNDGDPDIN